MFLANKFKIFITFTSPRVDGMLFSFRCCLYNLQLAKIVRPIFSFIKISDRDLKFLSDRHVPICNRNSYVKRNCKHPLVGTSTCKTWNIKTEIYY